MSFYRKTFFVIIVLLLYVIDCTSQSRYRIDLPDNLVAIDIISIDGRYKQVVSQNGIYEVNGRTLDTLITFKDFEITKNMNPIFDDFEESKIPSYPIIQGGYLSIISRDSILISHMDITPHSVSKNALTTLLDTDAGRFEINDNKIHFTQKEKIEPSKNKTLESILDRHHISKVLRVYMNQDSSYRILTKDKCLTIGNNKLRVDYEVDNENTDELISIHEDQNRNLWILSDKDIHIITPEYYRQYELPSGDKLYQAYKIRDRMYCSNGSQILELISDTWQIRNDLRPVRNISIDSSQNPFLIYNDKAILHDRSSAAIMRQEDGFPEEIITDINDHYISTTHNLYHNRVKISPSSDHYYKTLRYMDKVIAIGQSGIYLKDKNQLRLIFSATLPYSKNYFIDKGVIFFFSENTLNHISIEEPEIENPIALKKSKILDIFSKDEDLIVLTSNSVLYLDKKSLLRKRATIDHVIPIAPKLNQGQLTEIDDQLWVTTNNSCLSINGIQDDTIDIPSLHLYHAEDNNSINTYLKTDNFYSDRLNYTYYINTPTDQRMIWTRDPNLTLDYPSDTEVNIIAKMSDNVFVQDIYSNNVTISAKDYAPFDRLLQIIAAILATLLILWAIRMWIRP